MDFGRVLTHRLDDDEVEEARTLSSRSGMLSKTKRGRVECEVPSTESTGAQICQKLDDNRDGGESEGEAPETMTAAAGLNQSRNLASKAARAVERQKVAAIQKRKERDIRLKVQAHSRKRKLTQVDLQNDTLENAPPSERVNDSHRLQNLLPALLPDSILLVEPVIEPVSKNYPLPSKRHSTSHRLLNLIAVPPKDLKQGSKSVRVLESNRVLLPPRSALRGRTLRESWLSGRRSGGRDRNGIVPRRDMGNGFVRKS